MDFLKFSGEKDPGDWLSQVEQIFEFHKVDIDDRVIVAALNLKDHARVWFKIFHDIVDQLSWKQFRRALISRFGPNDYNYFGELTNLQQGRTVQEYLMEFETLLSKTNGLLTNQLVLALLVWKWLCIIGKVESMVKLFAYFSIEIFSSPRVLQQII